MSKSINCVFKRFLRAPTMGNIQNTFLMCLKKFLINWIFVNKFPFLKWEEQEKYR